MSNLKGLDKFEDDKDIRRMREVKERRKNLKFYCYPCKTETKHEILFEKGELIVPNEIVLFDDAGKKKQSVWTIEGRIWKLASCLGCEKIKINVFSRNSPLEDDVLIHQFPPKSFREFPAWIVHTHIKYVELKKMMIQKCDN